LFSFCPFLLYYKISQTLQNPFQTPSSFHEDMINLCN
jgi:hypothetical protein